MKFNSENGTQWCDHCGYTEDQHTGADLLCPEDDPTPWCHACSAHKQADCHCGPLAEND